MLTICVARRHRRLFGTLRLIVVLRYAQVMQRRILTFGWMRVIPRTILGYLAALLRTTLRPRRLVSGSHLQSLMNMSPSASMPMVCCELNLLCHVRPNAQNTFDTFSFDSHKHHSEDTAWVCFVCCNNYRCEVILPRTAKCPWKGVWVLIRLVFLDGSDLVWSVMPVLTHTHTHAHMFI